MGYILRSARYLAQDVLSRVILPGDTVIDATAGNGHDTCFLAGLVGETGHVYAFDIQPDAVERTRQNLREHALDRQSTVTCLSHDRMAERVTGPVRAVMFNLGWLPGGDKRITTHWETTCRAVDAALALLMPMGVCTICVYPGHAAGEEERVCLAEYLKALRPQEFNVLRQCFPNAGEDAPECYVIQKQ